MYAYCPCKKVFRRLWFIKYTQSQDFQNLARMIYPENPGLVDLLVWKIGKERCVNLPICEKDMTYARFPSYVITISNI
jgi:hypothetical protein